MDEYLRGTFFGTAVVGSCFPVSSCQLKGGCRLDFCAVQQRQEFPDCQKSLFLGWLSPAVGGEGKLRTPEYENQKSCFFLCLEFRFSEQNGEIQPEKVTRKIARKKVCIINHLYILAERGD
jgi:hypothetical protein